MKAKAAPAWSHWRTHYQAQIDELERELAEYQRCRIRISQLQPGETGATEQRITECNRLILLYRDVIERIDEEHPT